MLSKENEKKLIAKFVKLWHGNADHQTYQTADNLADYLAEKLDQKILELNKEIAAIRKNCPHPVTAFHGDPSGGNGSFTSCEICGSDDV